MRRRRVLVGVTGSVAAVKGPELACKLAEAGADVRVLLTVGGAGFWSKASSYDPASWDRMRGLLVDPPPEDYTGTSKIGGNGRISVYGPEAEWEGWERLGDPVLHVDLRDWADVLVLCPLSAHTLAKISNGLCDDALSCVVRAWDFGGEGSIRPGKPIVLAPAMNTAMWQHPLTKAQLDVVRGFWSGGSESESGVRIVPPQTKVLACGELGNGALADVEDVASQVEEALSAHCDPAKVDISCKSLDRKTF